MATGSIDSERGSFVRFLNYSSQLIEAFSQFAFAIIVFFMLVLPLAPLFKLLDGRKGFGWIVLTIVVMGAFYGLVRLLIEPMLNSLDKVRRGELLRSILGPLRNISAVVGIYGVFKLEYFLVHGGAVDMADASWPDVIWQFITQL